MANSETAVGFLIGVVGVERAIIELSFDVQVEMIEALLFELQASKVGQQIVKSVFMNVRFVFGL